MKRFLVLLSLICALSMSLSAQDTPNAGTEPGFAVTNIKAVGTSISAVLILFAWAGLAVLFTAKAAQKVALGISPTQIILLVEQVAEIVFPATMSVLAILHFDKIAEYVGIGESVVLIIAAAALSIAKLFTVHRRLQPMSKT